MGSKKVYLVGIIVSLSILIIRIIFVFDDYGIWDIIWLIVKTIFYIHLFAFIGFMIMKLQRLIYSEAYVDIRIFMIWIGHIFWIVFFLFGYMNEFNNSSLDFSRVNSFIMLPIGSLIENIYEFNKNKERIIVKNKTPKDIYEEKLITGKHRY